MIRLPEQTIPVPAEKIVRPFDRKLGTSVLHLPEGPAICTDAVSLTSITAEDANSGEQFLIVIAVAAFEGQHLGSLSPMTPDEAREFAMSLINAANLIDGTLPS